ncbi:MAG TPA: ABC transporter permease [Thermomicrobiales bacterium]|nr:ABC transporter permease [Thermomicrobiales bacterium]
MVDLGHGDAATAPAQAPRLTLPGWLRDASQTQRALSALILLSLYNAFFTTNFLTWATLRVNLTQVATIVIVGVGMTLVIATGGIDLSVGALAAIAGMIAPKIFISDRALLDSPWVAVPLAIVVPVLVAGGFGVFNGTLVTAFRIQPIIATLVLFLGGRGIAKALSNGNLVAFHNPSFDYIGTGRPLGIPVQVILMAVIVVVASWAMRRTTFGRYILATGGNEAAARLAGVPVDRTKVAVYTISGLLAGLAGLIVISLNTSADPNSIGVNMELDAIAAAAVGGTVLTGGRATVVGTLIGACIIHQIRYTLISHGVADGTTRIVVAITIILAVLLQRRGD